MSKKLTVDAIRQTPDVRTWPLEVPEWGGQVHVRELSLKQRWDFIRHVGADAEPEKPDTGTLDKPAVSEGDVERGWKAYKWLILNGISDEAGEPMFGDSDWDWLSKKSARVIERLAAAVQEHNGLLEGAVEDAAGN